jgi:sulfur-carrier protein
MVFHSCASAAINRQLTIVSLPAGYASRSFPTCILAPYHSISIYMPQIQIPSPLRQYSGKQASVDVQGKTVGEALSGLVSQHPDLKRHLYTEDGKLRSFVNVYVNDEDMRYLQKEATSLKDGDTISIVPSIAGGSEVRRVAPKAGTAI